MKEDGHWNISTDAYRLPVTDVDEERRNFSGYQVNQYFTMEDLIQGDTSGTTETDAPHETRDYGADGYTKINSKGVQQRSRWK